MSKRYISLSVILVVMTCHLITGQSRNWDYPVKPGSAEWNTFNTLEQKVYASQIPSDILKYSTTDILLALCLDYPLLADIMAFRTATERLLHLTNTFNGTFELLNRADGITEIDKKLSALESLISEPGLSGFESGKYIFQIRVLDMFRSEAVRIKKSRGLISTRRGTHQKLSDNSRDAIKGTPLKFTKLTNILTPYGSPINAFIVNETTDAEREYFDAYYRSAYPNSTLLTTYDGFSSTRRFNCHGYAWRMSEQRNPLENPIWIGLESNSDDDVYTTDGSYVQVMNEIYPGKVTWADESDHSAITTSEPGIWISKWNEFPLVKHKWNDTPYRVTSLKFYTSTAITGSTSSLCRGSERTFSVVNIPNAIYTWNTGPGLVVQTSTRNLITVKPDEFYTGLTHIEVTIESPLRPGESDIKKSPAKSFWIGKPVTPESIEELTDIICANQLAEFKVVDPTNNSNVVYLWEVVTTEESKIFKAGHPYGKTNYGSNYMAATHTGKSASVYTGNDKHINIRVRASNSCGLSNGLNLTVPVDNCQEPSYIIIKRYPNPVSDLLQVVVDDSNLLEGDSGDEYTVVITDLLYRTLHQGKTEDKRMTYNAGSLPKGIYLITIKTAGGYFIERFIRN